MSKYLILSTLFWGVILAENVWGLPVTELQNQLTRSTQKLRFPSSPHQEIPLEENLIPVPSELNLNETSESQEISSPSPNFAEISPLEDTEAIDPRSQITPVQQLQDLQPTDWAYESLQTLQQRYHCIQGYPNGAFQGKAPLSRYEFAAALNACLDSLERLNQSNPLPQAELLALQRLQENFASELITLREKVETIDTRLTDLENNQFSPTMILGGQTIFALAGGVGGRPPGKGETEILFTQQVQLALVSSFTGRDRFLLAMAAGNFDNLGLANRNAFNTYMALLNFQTGTQSQVVLNSLEYRTAAFGDRVILTFKPLGFSLGDVLTPNTPYLNAGGGAISRFASANPVFQIGALSSGLGFDWLVNDYIRLQVAYGDRNSSSEGLGRSSHRALGAQLLLKPEAATIIGVNYINGFASDGRLDTLTGSFNADTSGTFLEPANIHSIGLTYQNRLSETVVFGAWGGLMASISERSNAFALSSTFLVSLGIADPFGRQGDLIGFLAGVPPKLRLGAGIERLDKTTGFHLELFYRLRLNDHISTTLGGFVVSNPGHIESNNTIFVGALRTTFRF